VSQPTREVNYPFTIPQVAIRNAPAD